MPLPRHHRFVNFLTVCLIQLLISGCSGSKSGPDTDAYDPIKAAITNGNDVWQVRIDQEDDILHFYILESDKVVGYHMAFLGSDTGTWRWENWEESGTASKQLDGLRDSGGTITIHTTTKTSLMTIDSKRSISGGKVTGQTKTGSTSRSITGTAQQIN